MGEPKTSPLCARHAGAAKRRRCLPRSKEAMEGGDIGSEPARGKVEGGEEEGGEKESACCAWAWGAGTEGQLGVGGAKDELSPRPVRGLGASTSGISHIACGGAHAIALTGDGNVLTWGRGTCGQLGQGELRNCLEPSPVKSLKCFTISHVSAGWNHSGFVTDSGCLFTCGDGSFGQLGHGDRQSCSSPREVAFFASQNVMQIACGMRHSLALIKGPSGDVVFGFGSGKHGQLGVPADGVSKSFDLPKVVHHFENDSVETIYANGDNSTALAANGQLYIWGRGFSGRLSACVPQTVSSLRFSQVALGWNHALALTDSFTISVVRRVPLLDGQRVVHIAAGAEHSVLVTENGAVMTWGWGEHGQLGLGDTLDQTSPQVVNIGETGSLAQTRFRVFCGSGFSLALLNHSWF
ncbi:hypothetical protein Taro_012535 [Colocasia esculenta]|uniref:RCC1-like domain-containing protein n=1 Tax=Colocasia esculenta TaxID=4460 RepID=A0A843UDS5_COLES|nr:hypothetical protein [Colocasia esculenta]